MHRNYFSVTKNFFKKYKYGDLYLHQNKACTWFQDGL